MAKKTKSKKKTRDREVELPVDRVVKKKSKLAKKKKKLDAALVGFDINAIAANTPPEEKDYLKEYTWMFKRFSRLIRKVEKQVKSGKNTRAIYPLNLLVSQQREIIADIRQLSDLSSQINMVRDNVLQPMVSAIGSNTVDVFYQLRKLLMETTDKKQTQFALRRLEELTKEQAKFLQMQYQEASAMVNTMFSEPDAVKKPKKLKAPKK